MKLIKIVISSFLVILLTINMALAAGGSVLKLGEVLFKKSELLTLLTEAGVKKSNAEKMVEYARLSLESFVIKKSGKEVGVTNAADLQKFLTKIGDIELGIALSRNAKDLKGNKDALVDTLSKLYYKAGTHGRRGSFLVVCGACASDSLKEEKLAFTLEKIFDGKSGNMFTEMIKGEKSKTRIARMVRRKLRGLGINPKELDEIDERPIAMFFELRSKGSAAQKEFVQRVLDLHKTGEKEYGKLLENKLWNNIDLFENNENLEGWNALLKETKDNVDKYGESVQDAWYRALDKRAKGNAKKMASVEEMRAKNCFKFKF